MEQSEGGTYLPLSKIEPRADQPRSSFDEEALSELADSISEHGLIQPITVRKLDGGYYQIIAGERRWRAARMAGLKEVPVRIMEADDQETAELALIENLQREDLNPVEEAKGYRSLMDSYGMTQEKVAERVGKSRPVVANSLRLLNLPEEVLKMLEDQELTLSHARAVLELSDKQQQLDAARETVQHNLSVRETTALVKRMTSGTKEKTKKNSRIAADGVDYIAEAERQLTGAMGRKVHINQGAKRGRLEIEYYDSDDFERLYSALMELKPGAGGTRK
ncbi:MAG: ParB/RepB/Spo0J family partition protein [Oscillospiraceae bacterium]